MLQSPKWSRFHHVDRHVLVRDVAKVVCGKQTQNIGARIQCGGIEKILTSLVTLDHIRDDVIKDRLAGGARSASGRIDQVQGTGLGHSVKYDRPFRPRLRLTVLDYFISQLIQPQTPTCRITIGLVVSPYDDPSFAG